ncbi:hypothetical protein [Sphingomonas bacterium]|uniref:hypothetical protein n=1 Tax=Sphingomonas bacterium TaxID=1895847 RepID=UPI0015761979|nr:hypothetical protein [Sphingomonas bacterium]
MSEAVKSATSRRMNLVKSDCEVRDDRWSIRIDAGDDPCGVWVVHRQYGDFYDWPEASMGGGDCRGGVCPAADRAYTMQDESNYRTRSAALKAAHEFLRRFGAGEVEYLEYDRDSQERVVVGHAIRRHIRGWWSKDEADTPDPLAPFYPTSAGGIAVAAA